MASVKERIKELIDELPEDVAVEFEQLVMRLAHEDESRSWFALSASAFASFFDDDEVEYTEADVPARS